MAVTNSINNRSSVLSSGTITMDDAANIAVGTGTGTSFGTSTSQKIGHYGVTPVVQASSTADLRTAMINFGILATGGATPLNLNGGALTAGTTNLIDTSGISTNNGTAYFKYTTGTWTPALSATNLNITYTTQAGSYVQIGKLCTVTAVIVVNAVTNGGTSVLSYTGLPFAAANINSQSWGILYMTGATTAAADMMMCNAAPNGTTGTLFGRNYVTGADVNLAPVVTTQAFYFSLTYITT